MRGSTMRPVRATSTETSEYVSTLLTMMVSGDLVKARSPGLEASTPFGVGGEAPPLLPALVAGHGKLPAGPGGGARAAQGQPARPQRKQVGQIGSSKDEHLQGGHLN